MRKPRQTKSVLVCVMALLLASGIVRIAIGFEPALAYAEEQFGTARGDMEAQVQEAPDIEPLILAIQSREERISQREVAIEDRLRALRVAEEELTKRLEQLEEAEASLRAALTLSETANDSDIARLTSVYENMKPADAAGLFEQMAPEFASGFLVRMNPEYAAPIMAGLEPQTAYSISVIIAGRNANAPTQ